MSKPQRIIRSALNPAVKRYVYTQMHKNKPHRALAMAWRGAALNVPTLAFLAAAAASLVFLTPFDPALSVNAAKLCAAGATISSLANGFEAVRWYDTLNNNLRANKI